MSTSIIKSLRFVRGAFDVGHFVPAFRNYAIHDSSIQGTDGVVTLNAGIETDLSVCVDAHRFSRAIVACEGEESIELFQTKSGGNLRIDAGSFRAFVPVNPEVAEFPWSKPSGDAYGVPEDLIESLKSVRPFVGTDATRPWSQGVLINAGKLYTTNNVILIETVVADDAWNTVENVVLPTRAVDELNRIGVQTKRMLIDNDSVTFMYSKTWWLKSLRIVVDWPDIAALFEKAKGSKPSRITDEFRAAFARLRPFVAQGGSMYFIGGMLSSENHDEVGAMVEGFPEDVTCAFQAEAFRLVLDAATHIDFLRYPSPLPFVGKQVKGLLAPNRMTNTGPEPTVPTPEEVKAQAKAPAKAPAKKALAKKSAK